MCQAHVVGLPTGYPVSVSNITLNLVELGAKFLEPDSATYYFMIYHGSYRNALLVAVCVRHRIEYFTHNCTKVNNSVTVQVDI